MTFWMAGDEFIGSFCVFGSDEKINSSPLLFCSLIKSPARGPFTRVPVVVDFEYPGDITLGTKIPLWYLSFSLPSFAWCFCFFVAAAYTIFLITNHQWPMGGPITILLFLDHCLPLPYGSLTSCCHYSFTPFVVIIHLHHFTLHPPFCLIKNTTIHFHFHLCVCFSLCFSLSV